MPAPIQRAGVVPGATPASLQRSLTSAGAWLIAELMSSLWIEDFVRLARSARHLRDTVSSQWRGVLVGRGFALAATTRLQPWSVSALERWGGQGWDIWWPLTNNQQAFFRNWRHGSKVLLDAKSNGWFEFQVRDGKPVEVFYSSGVIEDADTADLHIVRTPGASGGSPLLQSPKEELGCWHLILDVSGLSVLFGLPGVRKRQPRLRFFAEGFAAVGEAYPSTALLVVERGLSRE